MNCKILNFIGSVGLPHWRHVLLEVPSNLSSSVPSGSLKLHSTLVFPLGFSTISNMHLYKCAACCDMYLSLQAMVTLDYGGVMNFVLMHWS